MPPLARKIAQYWVALLGCPLNACLADADLAGGIDDRRPGIVRQRNAVLGALSARLTLGIAGDHDGVTAGNRLGLPDKIDVAGDLAVKEMRGVDDLGVDVEGEHAVGEAPVGRGRARPGQRAAEQLADEGETRALVLAEGPDRAGAFGMI